MLIIKQLGSKYEYSDMLTVFAWLSEPWFGIMKQVSTHTHCRELSISRFCNNIKEKGLSPINKVSTTKLRLLFTIRYNYKTIRTDFRDYYERDQKWMNEAVRVLNILEDYMGWTSTKITQIKGHKLNKRCHRVFKVVGPAEWLQASPLISLYLLILRSAKNKDLYKKFKSMSNCNKIKYNKYDMSNDSRSIVKSCKEWKTILDNYDYLFKFRSLVDNMEVTRSSEGIKHMLECSGGAYDSWHESTIRRRWRNIKNGKQENKK